MVRNPGRLLAPIAIVAVAVGVYLIVQSNSGTGTHSAPRNHSTAEHVHRVRGHTTHRRARAAYYTVRSGDTMSEIASATKTPLARLEALNASLAPTYTLHTGQRLRLRR